MAEQVGSVTLPEVASPAQQIGENGASPATEQTFQGAGTVPGPVPYDRFSQVVDARNAAEVRARELEAQLMVLSNQRPSQAQPPDDQFFPGVADDDILTVKQAKQAFNRAVGQVQSSQAAIAFRTSAPDYTQVVGDVDPVTQQFRFAPGMIEATKRFPALSAALAAANPAIAMPLAYAIGKLMATELAAKQTVQGPSGPPSNVLPSPSMAGTGGAVTSQAANVTKMSKEEFEAYLADLKRRKPR